MSRIPLHGLICASALLATGLIAQTPEDTAGAKATPARAADSRSELVAAVAKAHRTGDRKEPIDRYTAELKVRGREVGAKDDTTNIDLTLTVRYGAAIERAKGVPMEMFRYQLEGRDTVVRGLGPKGQWHVIGGKFERLTKREHQQDRELLDSHLRLCKQMLRFLDPARILSDLRVQGEGQPVVRTEKVFLPGKGRVDALHIEGSVASFPVFRNDQKVRQEFVWMKAWVDKKTSRLLAVKVYPLQDGKPQLRVGELIVLDKYVSEDGVLIPTELKFIQVDGEKRTLNAEVNVQAMKLNPELSKADFEQ